MTGRRSFLGTLAAAGVATATGLVVVPSPPESPATVSGTTDESTDPPVDLADASWFDATQPITDEDATPIARYQYKATETGYEPTAPINVVVSLAGPADVDLETVIGVFEDAGWTRELEEYTRYAWDRTTERYVLQEATAAETYYGTSGRLHVRCWEFEGVVSIQAHQDDAARPFHVIESYDRGRQVAEALFRANGWAVSRAAIDLDNAAQPDHDGYASVVWPTADDGDTDARSGTNTRTDTAPELEVIP
ncbi:twin-arginine translocation signal domain-containing protein [Halobacteria archaeon AArc-m2/3/4]|uniref:Twin-arginine translocation signal domain-containing protein n=1 Tax=Natronoglomus mannanivorans TaxID=2979990 RepID=A0ABT2QAM9_9EURY|nr:twin-arginine translocation signal domain-containing protein [Halobacteria archaeon AArc-m2/3/4]